LKNQLFKISCICLLLRTIAQGLLPLLPVFAANTGVNKLMIGAYMTITFIFLLSGSFVMSKVSKYKKFNLKYIVIISGLFTSFLLMLMGFADSFIALCIVTSSIWFFEGVTITTLNIITGIVTQKGKAGKAFGILAMVSLAGTILGGFIVGPAIQYLGKSHAFLLLGVINLISIIIAGFLEVPENQVGQYTDLPIIKFTFQKPYRNILFAIVLATLVLHFIKMALSLSMKDHGYTLSQISTCVSYGTILAFPFAYYMGSLADRYSKKTFLLICLSGGVVGSLCYSFNSIYILAVMTIFSVSFIAYCIKGVVSSIVLHFYQDNTFKQALAWFDVTSWFGAILGYALSGVILQQFGFKTIGYTAFILSVTSVIIVLFGFKIKKA